MFGPTQPSIYWSSSSYAADASYTLSVSFDYGRILATIKTTDQYARAVRSGR
jgi:hypothetical protein